MNASEFMSMVLEIFAIPLFIILGKFVVNYIRVKTDQILDKIKNDTIAKYIRMARETVTACVTATNQTFVETLKKAGKFDKEAQQEAFNRTKESVLYILTGDASRYLTEAVGDLDIYLNSLIEAEVNSQKANITTTS